MFFIILFSVLHHSSKKDEKDGKLQKLMKKAIITIVLVVMFGVGWIFGILGSSGIPVYISYPCQIVFVVVVGFQGLLIFIFYPCRSKDTREEWKKWYYYVTCRQNTYNEVLKLRSKQSVAKSNEHSSTAFTTDKGVKKRVSEQSISSSASTLEAKFGYKRDRSASIDSESSVVSSETSSSTLTGRRLLKQDTIALAVLDEEDEDYNNIIAEETAYLDSNFVSSAEAASAQELTKEVAKVKPIVKQMLVFENSDALIPFEDDENEQPSVSGIDNDHDQFSHENLYLFENPGASEENVPDDLITWRTVNEEEDGVAETIFYKFEDDIM